MYKTLFYLCSFKTQYRNHKSLTHSPLHHSSSVFSHHFVVVSSLKGSQIVHSRNIWSFISRYFKSIPAAPPRERVRFVLFCFVLLIFSLTHKHSSKTAIC
jgi:hypothetical protein